MSALLRKSDIYEYVSGPYDLLVSKEDYMNNIPKALFEIADFHQKDVVDLGAGTGRLTLMAAPLSRSVTAVDFAADMLKVAANKLSRMGLANWKTVVSDLRQIPLEDQCADIVMAGWSICYVSSSSQPDRKQNLLQVMNEIDRILRPNGTVILLETLGTGNESPHRLIFCFLTSRRWKNGMVFGIGRSGRIMNLNPCNKRNNCAGIFSGTGWRIEFRKNRRKSCLNVQEFGGAVRSACARWAFKQK
jgi:ubiquinone/menaquinone biosynthesis C-methylase UbiE